MKIPAILVGCGNFSFQRLEILIKENQFEIVACVDIDVEKAKCYIEKIKCCIEKKMLYEYGYF